MRANKRTTTALTPADLDFLVSAAAPEVADPGRLRQILTEDDDFRNAFLENDETIRKVLAERETFARISPSLYFEILLRKARQELARSSHTLEYDRASRKVAVFDTGMAVELLSKPGILQYLGDMLASFTRVERYSVHYRVGERTWRRLRFDDTDVDALVRLMEFAGEEDRLPFYKRIADICLFLLGIFPDYVRLSSRFPLAGEPRPRIGGALRRSPEEYQEEGKKYYKLAALHPMARSRSLEEVFQLLHDGFQVARKPLNVIAERFIRLERKQVFAKAPERH